MGKAKKESYPFRGAAIVMVSVAIVMFAIGFVTGEAMPKWMRMTFAFYMALVGMSAGPMFSFQYPDGYSEDK